MCLDLFSTVIPVEDTVYKKNKLINKYISSEHKLLRIPIGGRLTSFLFIQRGRAIELGATEKNSR